MYDGVLDEIVILNRALTEDEMQTLMNDGMDAALSVAPSDKLATLWASLKQ